LNKEGQGRSEDALTSREQGEGERKRESDAPLTPFMKGEEGWHRWSHERLVKKHRTWLREYMQVYEEVSPPEEVIREALLNSKVREGIPGKHYMFYSQLLEAWDALAYDRYIPGERNERLAGHVLQARYEFYDGEVSTVNLSKTQAKIIDALAEVVGIPRGRGQTKIEIPEKLRHYRKWRESSEYQERVAKANK
jgi:hypothetical protein